MPLRLISEGRTALLPDPPPHVREFPADSVFDEEGPLGPALEYWRTLRWLRGGIAPVSEFRLDEVPALGAILGSVHVVDVTPDDPMEYRFERFGEGMAAFLGWRPATVRDIPERGIRTRMASDFREAAGRPEATLHKVALQVDFRSTAYSRLMLPLGGDRARAERLVVCCSPDADAPLDRAAAAH
jgi:hypothetical protein